MSQYAADTDTAELNRLLIAGGFDPEKVRVPVPPVCTAYWTPTDWFKWISTSPSNRKAGTMTKKHITALAALVAKTPALQSPQAVSALAQFCHEQNPRFDFEKWIAEIRKAGDK